ncbi:hypothetical protein HPB48_010493 [Haemaphysalis longicornis]|uniref:Uncharacterized protein n=1 Tax=Haemaphysalis longicornis TaxID=44386 RepID=A0A9J6GSV6_HAELO|nr:hypothetical protein HPB48_010493 [Haemaphysalis longicornis]
MIAHPEHEDANLMPSQDLVRLIKHVSPPADVRKRQGIMNRDEYYNCMRMTNAGQHKLLYKIIQRETTPSASPLWVFFTGPAGCGKTFVLLLAVNLYNRYSNTGNNTAYNAFVTCASTEKAAVAVRGTTVQAASSTSSARAPERRLCQWEEPRCTRLSSYLGRPPAPTKTDAPAPAS